MKDIGELRKEIDDLDREIVSLLNKRAKLALDIGKRKSEKGKEVYDPKREAEVLGNLRKANDILPEGSLMAIYREIISASRSLEKTDIIVYPGPDGSFSHEAAISVFGSSATFLPLSDWGAVFDEVAKGNAQYGVVPVENSTDGSINISLDLLAASPLYICAERTIPANQNLLSNCKGLKDIKTLYSHPQPLAQCRKFIARSLSGVKVVETSSTSAAAKMAAGKKNSAALASMTAAKIYGLNALKKNVHDFANNMTRFVVLSAVPAPNPRGTVPSKTSIAVTLKNKPGELHNLLGSFEEKGLNLTKIFSRPIPGSNWTYLFYIDFEGHRDDPAVAEVLEKVASISQELKIFGSYPMETARRK